MPNTRPPLSRIGGAAAGQAPAPRIRETLRSPLRLRGCPFAWPLSMAGLVREFVARAAACALAGGRPSAAVRCRAGRCCATVPAQTLAPVLAHISMDLIVRARAPAYSCRPSNATLYATSTQSTEPVTFSATANYRQNIGNGGAHPPRAPPNPGRRQDRPRAATSDALTRCKPAPRGRRR
jgi:hypothetical protein